MTLLLKLVVLPVLLVVVKAEYPLDFEEEPIYRNDVDATIYRIPESLDPIHMYVEITPYFEAEGDKEAFTFDGTVKLTVRAVENNIAVLTVQENVREIVSVTLTDESGVPILVNETLPFERVREYHFLRVYLRDGVQLVNGQIYHLTIEYIGNINETPLSRGIFRGSYRDDNNVLHYYAASHLQPVNSRQAFPSFDEPGFKSTFDIVINRPANFNQSYSNMKIKEEIPMGNRVKEIFHTTPRMSAYLVSVHISEEFTVIADNNDAEKSYRILARPNANGQGEYALEVGPPITEWLDNYFGIPYYNMAEDIKNDQIAVPDWASGATENWGLVSYRELRLLYEDGETNALDKMTIGTITAHELAHKWFGNLITCRWWDNVWINEGFASYFEYFAMDGVDPSMELEDQFIIMYLQSALSADSAVSTRALQHTVNSPAEVTGHFSGISYSKGASLLNMLKHFISEDTFKKALNYFLIDRAYEHAFPEDLFRNFAIAVSEDATLASNVDIAAFMRYWVNEPGYPLLTVEVNSQTGLLSLSQKRFFISPSAAQTQQVWPLPLTYSIGTWENTVNEHYMSSRTDEIQASPNLDFVIFNVKQTGIYRVNYNTEHWETIAEVLKTNPERIHYLNRAQIVDDVFALMRAEEISYTLGFKILDFLKQETNYYVWYPAITGFNWLRNRFLHIPAIRADFDEILYEFLDKVVEEVGYSVDSNENLTRTLNRFFLLSFACNIGHPGCIEDAVQRFEAFKTSGTSVNPNIRRHVFCTALKEGTYTDWRILYDLRTSSNNQANEVALLRALGCSNDEQAVGEYLELILEGEVVKAQDRLNAFTFLFMGGWSNTNKALQFLKTRIDDVRQGLVLQTWFNSLLSNMAAYLDEPGLQDMESWLRANQASIPEASTGLSAVTSARASMEWGTERASSILSAARGSALTVLPSIFLILTSMVAVLVR